MQSAVAGGVVVPLIEPSIQRLIKALKNLPPAPASTNWGMLSKPLNLPNSDREKLLIEKLEDLEKKLRGMYQDAKNQEFPFLSENECDVILIPG